nr:outer membrane protein assembly factor BamB [uncultured Moellerella sp.]
MQLRKTLLVGLVASVLLTGCSSETDSIVMAPLPKVENQFTPTVVWDKSVGDGVGEFYSDLTPVWDGEAVYAADRKGLIRAFELASGKELWSVNLSQRTGFLSANLSALLSGGLSISGDKIFVGTERGKLIALDKNDGKVVWDVSVAGEALSMPVIGDGLVLTHTSNGMLQALDENTGELKWTVNLETPSLSVRGESAPAVAFGAAVVGGDNGRVSTVLLSQGQLIWQQRISQVTSSTEIGRLNDIDMTPIIDDGMIYAIAYNGTLSALDMRSGQVKWKRELGSVNNMVLSGENLYLVDQTDRVLSVRKSDGVTLWTQDELLNRNLTPPEMYNGYLVVGDAEGYLHWLDMSNGQFIAQNKVSSAGLLSRPVVASDKLMVQAKNGTVYLLAR